MGKNSIFPELTLESLDQVNREVSSNAIHMFMGLDHLTAEENSAANVVEPNKQFLQFRCGFCSDDKSTRDELEHHQISVHGVLLDFEEFHPSKDLDLEATGWATIAPSCTVNSDRNGMGS